MKKLMIAAFAVIASVATVKAETYWSTWYDAKVQNQDLGKACVFGLASEVGAMSGAQIDLCISKATDFASGCQFAFGYSRVVTLRNGCQVAFWNNAKSAALQVGLICHNETGFLPWFPFFNLDTKQFGAKKEAAPVAEPAPAAEPAPVAEPTEQK